MKYQIDYSKLPEHMRGAFERYIEYGIEPGHFGMAVLCNDLMAAFQRADETNRKRMIDIMNWLYNDAPSACHGSLAKVEAWKAMRRTGQDE